MRMVTLPDGTRVPALGQGTWKMGEDAGGRKAEAAALRLGLDLGLTLIDTAEMYAEGGAEEVVAEALAGQRDRAFIVSKVYPHNASRRGVAAAAARSLKRLKTDRIDLYLLHWRGGVPLEDTVAGFEDLRDAGKILRWGVSNLDTDDMEELFSFKPGRACATNQVLYNPEARGIEFDLLPWCAGRKLPVMAYSPIGQGGRLLRNGAMKSIAERHGVSTAQVALAWALRHPGIIAIPKASDEAHVRDNAAAASLSLSNEDFAAIDAAYPPPTRKRPLAMI